MEKRPSSGTSTKNIFKIRKGKHLAKDTQELRSVSQDDGSKKSPYFAEGKFLNITHK